MKISLTLLRVEKERPVPVSNTWSGNYSDKCYGHDEFNHPPLGVEEDYELCYGNTKSNHTDSGGEQIG